MTQIAENNRLVLALVKTEGKRNKNGRFSRKIHKVYGITESSETSRIRPEDLAWLFRSVSFFLPR